MAIKKIVAPAYEKDPPPVRASKDGMKTAAEAQNALYRAFDWGRTAEGHAFWSSVANRLQQIAKDGVLK